MSRVRGTRNEGLTYHKKIKNGKKGVPRISREGGGSRPVRRRRPLGVIGGLGKKT